MAYKRELIINNGSLTSYKKLLKVSDVCQLLDKSKYLNNDGYINNGDGTITTKSIPQNFMRIYNDFDINDTASIPKELSIAYRTYGHKLLILDSGNNSPGTSWKNSGGLIWEINSTRANAGGSYSGQGEIFTNNKLPLKDITRSYFYIVNPSGYTFTCAPQLFDLTEMYGAGHEPATVAEFKAKFPNELYDYSPRCWVKSYKTGLIAKTKNLFDYKTPEYVNATLIETLSNGAILKGNLSNNSGDGQYPNGWFRPGDAHNKRIELKTGDIVTISADYTLLEQFSSKSNSCNIHLYCDIDSLCLTSAASTVKLPLNKTVRISQTYTIKGDADYYPVFTLNSNKVKITNIQIEKGTTATDYVPFGYL